MISYEVDGDGDGGDAGEKDAVVPERGHAATAERIADAEEAMDADDGDGPDAAVVGGDEEWIQRPRRTHRDQVHDFSIQERMRVSPKWPKASPCPNSAPGAEEMEEGCEKLQPEPEAQTWYLYEELFGVLGGLWTPPSRSRRVPPAPVEASGTLLHRFGSGSQDGGKGLESRVGAE